MKTIAEWREQESVEGYFELQKERYEALRIENCRIEAKRKQDRVTADAQADARALARARPRVTPRAPVRHVQWDAHERFRVSLANNRRLVAELALADDDDW